MAKSKFSFFSNNLIAWRCHPSYLLSKQGEAKNGCLDCVCRRCPHRRNALGLVRCRDHSRNHRKAKTGREPLGYAGRLSHALGSSSPGGSNMNTLADKMGFQWAGIEAALPLPTRPPPPPPHPPPPLAPPLALPPPP